MAWQGGHECFQNVSSLVCWRAVVEGQVKTRKESEEEEELEHI